MILRHCLHQIFRRQITHASTNLEEMKGMLNVLLTKVSENEKAINALKEEIK